MHRISYISILFNTLKTLTRSNIETLSQVLQLLLKLSDAQYVRKQSVSVSSVGQHIRHIVDHYSALSEGHDAGYVNYNKRNRCCEIEYSRAEGIAAIRITMAWLNSYFRKDKKILINTEISLTEQNSEVLDSTLSRELYHLMSHTTHHLAYIALLVKNQGVQLSEAIGVAPATATWQRQAANY